MTTGRVSAAALVALVAWASGCDATGGSTARQPVVTVTPVPIPTRTPASSPTQLPTQSSEPAPESVTTGSTRRVESSGVSLEVPARWLELDAAELADGMAAAPQLAELAERSGLTRDQLLASVRGVDLALFDDAGASGGYVNNVTVLSLPGSAPTATLVEFSLLQIGASDVLSTHVRTALGDAISASYRLTLGATTIHGVMVVVTAGDRAAAVTVNARDAGAARRLGAIVTRSVRAADPPTI